MAGRDGSVHDFLAGSGRVNRIGSDVLELGYSSGNLRKQQPDAIVPMTSGVVGQKGGAGQGDTVNIWQNSRGKLQIFRQRLLVLVANFAIFDENFQTKIRFSYNFSIAQNFGRSAAPLPPLPRRQCLLRLCPEFYALREQSVALGLPHNFYKSNRGSL